MIKKRRAVEAEPLVIAGVATEPGQRQRLEIPVAPLFNQQIMTIPVIVVRGTRPGPRLWVSGTIHGDELIGLFIIRELLQRIEPADLSGALILVPAVNPFGLLHESRYLPDRRDLNRSFPGSARGSLAARIAYLFMKEVVANSTHGIDLHTGAIRRSNLPQVRANLDDRATRACARAFGAPVTIHATERDGSLRQAASARGVVTLLYEAGEALRHDPEAVRAGLDGVLRVMRAIRMIRGGPAAARRTFESHDTRWVRANGTGYLVLDAKNGDRVAKDERIGRLYMRLHRDFGPKPHLDVLSPIDGIVIGRVESPLVSVGDALVHIAAV